MKFSKRLIKGKLIKRYKRFFTDINIKNKIITAHCPNTGSMMGLLGKNNDVWISKNNDPIRILAVLNQKFILTKIQGLIF
jgi:sugar fermentation stimulation protein A